MKNADSERLREIANELIKGMDMDCRWLQSQSPFILEIADRLYEIKAEALAERSCDRCE